MKRYTKTQMDLIEQSICTPLRKTTERNAHTEAVVFLAENLLLRKDCTNDPENCENLYNWAKYIKAEHERIGSLPFPLYEFRRAILMQVKDELKRIFQNNEVARMIDSAL